MAHLFIAIDGTAGSGKSSAARGLARALGLRYIDSGAYYRAVGVAAEESTVNLHDQAELQRFLTAMQLQITNTGEYQKVIVNGKELSKQIRTDAGSKAASSVAKLPAVREFITDQLRSDAAGGCVMEGRDIGTVVLPGADFKFFLDASPAVRAMRRAGDSNYQQTNGDVEEIRRQLEDRDTSDKTRSAAPLKPARDAIVIDSSEMNLEEVVNRLVSETEQQG